MNRKAQISTFMIIGIVFVLLAALLYYALGPEISAEEAAAKIPAEAQPLKLYVEECLKTTAYEGISLAGIQGGYTDIPPFGLETEYSTVAYYYYRGNNTMPSKQTIESQISSFIEKTIDVCLNNLSSFREQGFNVSYGGIAVDATIREKDVYVNLDFSVLLEKTGRKIEISKYYAAVPIRIGHAYDIARAVTERTKKEPEWVDLAFLSDFDVKIDVLPYSGDSFVYSISDQDSLVENEPFVFLFANNFVVNQPPVLDIPEMLAFKDAKGVIMKLNATDPEGDPLKFSDDSAMFDITQDGVVLFLPEVPGVYNVLITVEDDHMNIVSKEVKFVIE